MLEIDSSQIEKVVGVAFNRVCAVKEGGAGSLAHAEAIINLAEILSRVPGALTVIDILEARRKK